MNKNLTQKIFLIVGIIVLLLLIILVSFGIIKKITFKPQNPIATIEIADYGTIKIELYPDQAPDTVSNFIALANNGFYNNSAFHRVEPGFMIQGGSKNGDGTTDSTIGDLKGTDDTTKYSIKGEMIANGYTKNRIKLEKGVIALSRADYTSISPTLTEESYNSGSSQFFIMHDDKSSINGLYAGFGKVISGMDIVDKIANLDVTYRSKDLGENEEVPTDENGTALTADMPLEKPVITKITVETFGIDYGYPETLEPFDYYSYLMKYYSSMYSGE